MDVTTSCTDVTQLKHACVHADDIDQHWSAWPQELKKMMFVENTSWLLQNIQDGV